MPVPFGMIPHPSAPQSVDAITSTAKQHVKFDYIPCLKNCAKLFLSELRQISTNFDNFWQKDGKEAKIL